MWQAVKAHRVVRRRGSHIFSRQSAHSGGKVVSLTCRPPFTPQEDSRYSFLLEAESTPGPYSAGRIRSILIGTWTHDLPACSQCLNQLRCCVPQQYYYYCWSNTEYSIQCVNTDVQLFHMWKYFPSHIVLDFMLQALEFYNCIFLLKP
jgi:hypothetical protein